MVDVAKGRGRPKGSGKNDSGPLMMVARLIVDDPKLMPTTAMRRVLRSIERHRWPETDETLIRRWQVKWKVQGAACLQKVQAERAAAEAERERREKAAAQACLNGARMASDLATGVGALLQSMPRQAIGEAVLGIFAQHQEMAQSLGNAIVCLADRGMLPSRSSAFDTLSKSSAFNVRSLAERERRRHREELSISE